MNNLFSALFWRSIGWALVRTVLAGLVPFLPAIAAAPTDPATWIGVGSALVVLVAVAIATSLKGLADPAGASWWQILTSRFLRQVGQFFAGGLVGAVVVSDLDWRTLALQALASGVSTSILAALTLIPGPSLPETDEGDAEPVDDDAAYLEEDDSDLPAAA